MCKAAASQCVEYIAHHLLMETIKAMHKKSAVCDMKTMMS